MSFFALAAALLLEHYHPLASRSRLYVWFVRLANALERHLNAGRYRYGVLAWMVAVLVPVLLVGLVHVFLARMGALFALAFDVVVLYVTLSVRQFTDQAAAVAAALLRDDTAEAEALLGRWRPQPPAAGLPKPVLVRLALEHLFSCAQRQFFAPAFWFVLLGPSGALLYRLAHTLHQKWGELDPTEFGRFGLFSARAFAVLDGVPSRVLALSFAIVGNFEDAVHGWREQARAWHDALLGPALAAGAGALGVRLGGPLPYPGRFQTRAELGNGAEPEPEHIEHGVGLVMRAVALWLAILLLLTISAWAARSS